MNLAEHPGPKAQVHLAGLAAPLFFSQVRDAVAYLRMPEQSHAITAIYVNDMARAPSWDEPGIAMGAEATITLAHPDPAPIIEAAKAEIGRLEAVFSLYRTDSALARLVHLAS